MFNFGSVDGAPDDAEEEDHDAAGLRCRLVELQRAISDAESLEGEVDCSPSSPRNDISG